MEKLKKQENLINNITHLHISESIEVGEKLTVSDVQWQRTNKNLLRNWS